MCVYVSINVSHGLTRRQNESLTFKDQGVCALAKGGMGRREGLGERMRMTESAMTFTKSFQFQHVRGTQAIQVPEVEGAEPTSALV